MNTGFQIILWVLLFSPLIYYIANLLATAYHDGTIDEYKNNKDEYQKGKIR